MERGGPAKGINVTGPRSGPVTLISAPLFNPSIKRLLMKRSRSEEQLAAFAKLTDLPKDVVLKIILDSGLSIQDMMRLCQINVYFQRICRQPEFWDRLFVREILKYEGSNYGELYQFKEWKYDRAHDMPNDMLHFIALFLVENYINLVRDGQHIDMYFDKRRRYIFYHDGGTMKDVMEKYAPKKVRAHAGYSSYNLKIGYSTEREAAYMVYRMLLDGWSPNASKYTCLSCSINPSTLQFEGRQETFCSSECAKTWWNGKGKAQ